VFHDDAYPDDVRPNATCSDCSGDYSRADDDPSTLCDACSDRRDVHTSRLERRLVMAKAQIARGPRITLTPRELMLCVVLLGRGNTLAQAIDRIQARRGSLPFTPEAA
jgi:hypothetical protein